MSSSVDRGTLVRMLLIFGLATLAGWLWAPVLFTATAQPAEPLEVVSLPAPTPRKQPQVQPAQPVPTPAPRAAIPAPKTQAIEPPTYLEPEADPPQLSPDGLFRQQSQPSGKTIALTFDDGPWPVYTEEVLEVLAREKVKATFFWLGRNVANYPDIARQVAQAGHELANHSYNHPTAPMDAATAQRELEQTNQVIEEATGQKTRLFRPPGGHKTNGLVSQARQEGYTVVMWSVQPNDWQPQATPQSIASAVLQQAQPGTVVLLHDGGGNRAATVAALPQIIRSLKRQGYQFVTVSQMLEAEATP
jgi:peptidoglycan/xylan/chitin deacetylase (PgdA/CDA1 family)